MADKATFENDPEVIAYQFINEMKKDGQPVKNKGGFQVQTISAMKLGKGGIDAGMNASTVNAGIADRSITGWVNGSLIVYKRRTGAGGGTVA